MSAALYLGGKFIGGLSSIEIEEPFSGFSCYPPVAVVSSLTRQWSGYGRLSYLDWPIRRFLLWEWRLRYDVGGWRLIPAWRVTNGLVRFFARRR